MTNNTPHTMYTMKTVAVYMPIGKGKPRVETSVPIPKPTMIANVSNDDNVNAYVDKVVDYLNNETALVIVKPFANREIIKKTGTNAISFDIVGIVNNENIVPERERGVYELTVSVYISPVNVNDSKNDSEYKQKLQRHLEIFKGVQGHDFR